MPYVLITLILLTSYQFVFWIILPIPPIQLLAVAYFTIFACILIYKRNIVKFPHLFDIVFFIQFVWMASYFIIHNDTSYMMKLILASVVYMALLYVYNSSKGIISFIKIYNGLILIMAICGTLCFFLLLFEVIKEPLIEYVNTDGRRGYCFGLTCTNTYLGNFIRYAGFFDEPGAMAGFGIYALVFNRLFIKSMKYEIILGVCLLFTFSLAYFIQLPLLVILFAKNKVKRVIQVATILAVVGLALEFTKDSPYTQIYEMTTQRFEYDSRNSHFEGDNRSELTELAKEQFYKSPIIGIGAKKMEEVGYMGDNPYEILAKEGIIGEIVTYLPLLLVCLVGLKRKPEYIYAAVVLFVGYLQRPFAFITVIHLLTLYSFTILTLQKEEHNYALP